MRKSRLLCDQAAFHILSFPHALAHPSLRWDWKRNFWNTRGRPFLWYCHPSQNQEALENLPKEKKKNQTARESLPAWFPSQGDLEKHLNVSEVIQTRPADFHSLFSVWVQPSELRCHWGGSYIWLLISSSDLPTVITYFPITKGCPAVQPTSNCKLKSLILENN